MQPGKFANNSQLQRTCNCSGGKVHPSQIDVHSYLPITGNHIICIAALIIYHIGLLSVQGHHARAYCQFCVA